MARFSHLVAVTALVGGLAIAGFASADPRDGRHEGPQGRFGNQIDFTVIDTDGDGSLSRAELMARATARIATADANNDGSLDRAELAAALPGPKDALVAVFATSPSERIADRILAETGNTETGAVTVQVLAERQVNELLANADTDRNAAISQEEADAARPGRPGMRHGALGAEPARPGAAVPRSNG